MCDAKNSPEPAFVSLPPLMFALANQLQVCCPNHVISSGFILSSFFNVLIFHFNILKSKLPHYVKFQGKIHRIPAPIHQNLTKVRPNDPQGPKKPRPFQERGTNIAKTGQFSHSAGSVCSGTKTVQAGGRNLTRGQHQRDQTSLSSVTHIIKTLDFSYFLSLTSR